MMTISPSRGHLAEQHRNASFPRAVIIVLVLIGFWFLLDSFAYLFAGKGFLRLIDVAPRSPAATTVLHALYTLNSAALLAALVLLLPLSGTYQRSLQARALAVARRQGALDDSEYERKSLDLQRDELSRHLDRMRREGVFNAADAAEMLKLLSESYRVRSLTNLLRQAHDEGVLSEDELEQATTRLAQRVSAEKTP
jgi:uncharacterized membrane protein YccC